MKNCREVEPLKTPYVDGESGEAERATVENHLSACGRCRNEVTVEAAARDVVAARREELRGTCPDALRASVASALKQKPQGIPVASTFPPSLKLRWASRRKWAPLSLAASLVLAAAAFFALGLTDKSQALAFQTTVDHVKCVRFNNSAAPADPAAEAQRWMSSNGWPVKVAASRGSDLELRALRRCAVTDGRVAHMIYQWKGQPLSVYVLPGEVLHHAAEVERFGHDAIMWGQNGRTYIVLTRKPRRPELDGVISYVKANVY